MKAEIVRGLLGEGEARVVAVSFTSVARDIARRHGAVGGAAVALSRAAGSALMLATLTKDEERVTLQVAGDGVLGAVVADATGAGGVRAYARQPGALVRGGAGRIALAGGVGQRGVLSVVRDLGLGELFTGQTPITSGEIDEDVEHYLGTSEQIDSALGCDALLDAQQEITAAGGILVQALPGSEGGVSVARVRERLREGALAGALGAGPLAGAAALALAALGSEDAASLRVLDTRTVSFHCGCTRERVADMLTMLGAAEIGAIAREQGDAQVSCNFCGESYRFAEAELVKLSEELKVRSEGAN